MMIKCSSGHFNVDGTAFCVECGIALATGETQSPAIAPDWSQPTAYPMSPPPARRKGLKIGLIVAGAVVLVVIAGVILFRTGKIGNTTTTLTVELTVFNDSGCNFGIGYADVPGSDVIIKSDGVIVATGNLPIIGSDDVVICTFTTRIANVPKTGAFYEIVIGRRGTGTATKAELEADGWKYSATLGF